MNVPEIADIIVVGGGAAGCVVAGRIAAAEKHLKVLVIERGPTNFQVENVTTPGLSGQHYNGPSKTAVRYECEKLPELGNRTMSLLVGNILGGGGSINALGYSRPSASDFDDWQMEGWSAKDMIPIMKKCETYQPWENDPLHGYSGPLAVSYGGTKANICHEWLKAAESIGIPIRKDLQDLNTGHGSYAWPKWIDGKTGKRSDTAHAYLHSQRHNPNLKILTEMRVDKVILEGNTAVAVDCFPDPAFSDSKQVFRIRARKYIVLSAGALATPGILERSGIGNPEILKAAGVTPVVDLPGVGHSYQDHQLTPYGYAIPEDQETMDDILRNDPAELQRVQELFKEGKGGLATNFADAGTKLRPTPEEVERMGPAFQRVWHDYYEKAPDKPVAFITVFAGYFGDPDTMLKNMRYLTATCWTDYPESRGTVHIKSTDPTEPPRFDCGFLTHPADIAVHVWLYKKAREIARRIPLVYGPVAYMHPKFSDTSDARVQTQEVPRRTKYGFKDSSPPKDEPPSTFVPPTGTIQYTKEDDAAIDAHVRENLTNVYHSAGTAAMKPRADGGVVDKDLNVYGVKGLKVADLSILPKNVGANTFGTAVYVGEKCAVIIGKELCLALDSKL